METLCFGATLWIKIISILWPFRWRRSPLILVFALWALIDYGRSLSRILLLASVVVIGFGAAYSLRPEAISYVTSLDPRFAPYAASLTVFSSFGIKHSVMAENALGQFLMSAESFLGYLLFGIFLSVLLLNISRRS